MESNYHEKIKNISPEDADFTGKWRPGDIFRAMQKVAEEHVEKLGCGFCTLREREIAWILTRMELVMERYPSIGETIRIATWPGTTKHSVYPRYFEFREEDGTLIGRAVSLWVVLDLKNRNMITMEKAGFSIIPEQEHGACLPFPSAPRALNKGKEQLISKIPQYSDLDVNRHVNNTHYIDWLCDLFPLERFEANAIRRILINYAGEIHAKEELTLVFEEDENMFTLRDCPDGKSHFTILGEWF